MQVNKENADLLKDAIDKWHLQGLLTDDQVQELKKSIVVRKFDWKQVAVYAFMVAVACAVLSIIVLLADKPLRILIEKFTQITDFGISSILTIASIFAFWYANKRFKQHTDTPFSNHSFLLLGAFLSLASISYWAKTLHVFQNNYAFVFLIAVLVYVVLAIYFRSQTLWALAICMLALSFGTYTTFAADTEQKFAGMNVALRFVPFSLLLFLGLWIIKQQTRLLSFFRIHYILCLLFFFISLWLLSIFGNYSSYERWQQVHQTEFLLWCALLFVITAIGMYIGLKRGDLVLGNTSLVFFILNLVTRYFEYFWEPLHKSIFFMILALLFWFIGSRAEKLWNLKFLEEK